MTTKEYTAGPWIWSNLYQASDGRETWSLVNKGGYGILSCDGTGNAPQGLGDEGNARLIAAAPDLLEALEGLLSLHEPEGRFQPSHYKPFLANARNALAKAHGRETLPEQAETAIEERDRIISALAGQMVDAAGAIDEFLATPCESLKAKLPSTVARLLGKAKQAGEMIAKVAA